MPFSDFCAPLVFDGWGQESLMERLLELGRERKWRYFELRGGRKMLPPSARAAEKYYGHKLDLTIGIEELFARFKSPVRRAIRKAEKSGLSVEASKTWEAMLDFYRLHVRTRRRHGLPPQPLSFFRNIDEQVVKAGLGFVVLAKRHLRPIAAAVFFHSGGEALYKFGASDERLQEVRGNNLVMWEGIKRLVGKGVKTMHFGRTTMSDEGLRRFKLSWGTKEEIIEYFKFAFGPNLWVNTHRDAPEFCNQLFGRLPLAANRLVGTLVYRHLD
ncbi:MAG TPA: GNAT family N-acetyltransferase [Chthoniobacterales bacterium]|nr:GNAT family N-acetyltransferase [Chthoniobacterales bacterium]